MHAMTLLFLWNKACAVRHVLHSSFSVAQVIHAVTAASNSATRLPKDQHPVVLERADLPVVHWKIEQVGEMEQA